jgi:hypothetical protein
MEKMCYVKSEIQINRRMFQETNNAKKDTDVSE